MPKNTLQRADDRLREQLKVDPPLKLTLVEDDEFFGTLVREEERTATNKDGEESHYEVAVFGDASLDEMTTVPKGFDGSQLVEVSLSGAILKRKWDELQPRPGERVGIRRLWETRTRAGRDAVEYNLAVDRDGDVGGDVPSPTEPLPDDDGYNE
jgi:hypothetical protein